MEADQADSAMGAKKKGGKKAKGKKGEKEEIKQEETGTAVLSWSSSTHLSEIMSIPRGLRRLGTTTPGGTLRVIFIVDVNDLFVIALGSQSHVSIASFSTSTHRIQSLSSAAC